MHDLERKRAVFYVRRSDQKLRTISRNAAKKQAGIRGGQQNGCAADGRNFQERDAIRGLFIEVDLPVVQMKIALAHFVERNLSRVQNAWYRHGQTDEN